MADKKITAQDVAEMAGVSQSAVSRVFTPGASVSEKMSLRVRRAAKELGYRPNVLARSLITGRSRIIGLVVAYLENQFYPLALEQLSKSLQNRGYHILIFMTSGTGEGVARIIDELLDYQVDGIITASVGMSDELTSRCVSAGIPVVMFNRGQADERLSQVTSNNYAGARRVAEFLLAGQHKRLAHITGWTGSSTGRDRERGFIDGLTDAGVAPVSLLDGSYDREQAADAARRMVETVAPDAIFVASDHMAFGVVDMLRHTLGVKVPEEVSVVGYDDVPVAAWPAYDLTTFRQPAGQMVEATVDALIERIETEGLEPKKLEIGGRLVIRSSARVPKRWPT